MFAAKRKAEGDGPAGKAAKLGGSDGDRKATFARNLAALNTQFASWVAEQAAAAPKELWTDGVEDYLKHAKQLLADFKDVLEGNKTEAAASKPPLPPPGSLFGGSGASAAAPPASIFGGLAPTSGSGAAAGGAGGAGGFGGFGGFGSGAGSAANSGGSGLFNVPSTGTIGSSFNTGGATAEDDEGEEEQDTEPSLQVEAGEGTELLAKHRVKLMSMPQEGKKWSDKGTGTLTLRRATGEDAAGKRPYFVFTTDSGRVLINAPLLKGMKAMSNAKIPAAVIMFLISCVEGKEEKGMHMFKCVEGADVAKKLLAQINELA